MDAFLNHTPWTPTAAGKGGVVPEKDKNLFWFSPSCSFPWFQRPMSSLLATPFFHSFFFVPAGASPWEEAYGGGNRDPRRGSYSQEVNW